MSELKLPEGTPILSMDSPTFAEDFAEAIGLKEGESIQFVMPQFDRIDGVQVPVLADFNEWETLHERDVETLKALGFSIWDETEKGKHWLFPKEWYGIIPNGFLVTDIFGKQEEFKRGETDDDYHYGCLSFGFIQESKP